MGVEDRPCWLSNVGRTVENLCVFRLVIVPRQCLGRVFGGHQDDDFASFKEQANV
jgi:hypothetical protein